MRLFTLVLCVLLCLFAVPEQSAQAKNYSLDFGGEFTLTNQHNEPFSLSDARGKVVMIFFGFTSCADTCPTTLIKMVAAMKQLGPLSERVLPVFISVDAKRDTPEVIRQYAAYFHPSMVALTGTQEEVEAVAKQYRTPVLVRKPSESGFYVVDHGSRLFFVNQEGGLANILMFEGSAEEIANIVKGLL
jgi:protein SCO1/2